jgi:KUP system potassium uptake protein
MDQVAGPRTLYASLALAAIGVVFGDIGTSPLYTMNTVFDASNGLEPTPGNIVGIVSLIVWSLLVVVSLKYVTLIMRANNHGEGGIMALLALAVSAVKDRPALRHGLLLAGVFGAALFYGDGVITPAISVLSAVEGLEIAAPQLKPYVIPVTLAVLIALFIVQRRGTAGIGAVFGPIMVLWFLLIGVVGLLNLSLSPGILLALNPFVGLSFLLSHGWIAFVALGSVVLALTGAEALYADMGHFGAPPIRLSWFALVFPTLVLNYLGQGALLLSDPKAVDNPFYHLFPSWAVFPMVVLATVATVIASQAVISGAYSMTRQAMQLGYLPRLRVRHTSDREIGQVYVPAINWTLLAAVVASVVGFGSSTALGSAYGIAVTGTMLITTFLTFYVVRYAWNYNWVLCLLSTGFFFVIDAAFFSANLLKFLQGGWYPLLIGAPNGVPHSLRNNLEHNGVLHDRVLFVHVASRDIPWVPPDRRTTVTPLGHNCWRVMAEYGFKDEIDLPLALKSLAIDGRPVDPAKVSYFMSHAVVVATHGKGMSLWRERLFAAMSHNMANVAGYLKLPANRVIELGTRVEI